MLPLSAATGIELRPGFVRSSSRNSKPSAQGILTSDRMTSGRQVSSIVGDAKARTNVSCESLATSIGSDQPAEPYVSVWRSIVTSIGPVVMTIR